jgi:predicted nucleic acid-binding protein
VALIVLDASVVIAHLDPADAHHEAATAALRERAEDDLVLPASAYAEALVDPARKGRLDTAREHIEALLLRIAPLDRDMAERAALLRAGDAALRLPDALVLAGGDVLGADAVLTTDRRWAKFERAKVLS